MESLFPVFFDSFFADICVFSGVLIIHLLKSNSGKFTSVVKYGLYASAFTAVSSLAAYSVVKYLMPSADTEYMAILFYVILLLSLLFIFKAALGKLSSNVDFRQLLFICSVDSIILYAAVYNRVNEISFTDYLLSVLGHCAGLLLAAVLLYGIRLKIDETAIPKSLRGFPITLIAAGFVLMAYFGLS